MHDVQELLDRMWQDYTQLAPQAERVVGLLEDRDEEVVNDHIALRTFGDPRVGMDVLAGTFLSMGYRRVDDYEFPEKKLRAEHYDPPEARQPKVFISELKLEACSDELRRIADRLVSQVPAEMTHRWDFPVSGRPWRVTWQDYETLASESEYAAWVAAFGFRPNHFTVLVNALDTFDTLGDLNAFLKDHGFALNTSGGEIKGTPEQLLEQSSTLAEPVPVTFEDGEHVIPGVYYEFARRYPDREGKLFGGFIARSADKIFESTDRR